MKIEIIQMVYFRGNYLIRDPMEFDDVNVEWLGHATVRIKSNDKTIYIDPFEMDENPEAADIILLTHTHYDHLDEDKIKSISKTSTKVVGPEDAKKKLANVQVMKPDEEKELGGIKLETVPAYNIGKDFHPKENNWLGYIVEINGKKIYHAGDTDVIPEMENLDVDIALLPIGGTYTMNQGEAVEAVKKINTDIVIPIHFGEISGTEADPEKFKKDVESKTDSKVEIL